MLVDMAFHDNPLSLSHRDPDNWRTEIRDGGVYIYFQGERSLGAERLGPGVYGSRCLEDVVNMFSDYEVVRDYPEWPEMEEYFSKARKLGYHPPRLDAWSQYGVADNLHQIRRRYRHFWATERMFVLQVFMVCKDDEPKDGGWRWHKWGPYIGTQNPRCEYIAHEPKIREVICFSFVEVKSK